MQRIHFVFPQTADAIFNLIRFQDTTRLRTFLVASLFLSSVSRGVCIFLVAGAYGGWCLCILKTKRLYYTCMLSSSGVLICECSDYYT